MKLKKHILVSLAILFSLNFFAQIEVHAVLDSSNIRIGEQTKLSLYLTYDANAQKNIEVLWPEIADTIRKEIEVLSVSEIDTIIPDKNKPEIIQQRIELTITAFDSGYYAIPPFKFLLGNDTSKEYLTEALLLEVHTVATDTSLAKIKDIKAPFDEPFDWKWYLPYAYWGLAILAVIIIIIILIKKLKRKPVEVIIETKPKIPAHITALQQLEIIKQEAVWKDNKIKEYYSNIADTVRLYIEERFNINALELTTDEVLHVFKSQVVDSDSKDKLKQILILSDFVKFAKEIPIEAEHTLTLNNAFDFVKGTLREENVLSNDSLKNNLNQG
jgi:hypothetical protein